MRYMLDTNICIYLIKNRPPSVREQFERCARGEIAVSSVTVAELAYGVQQSQHKRRNEVTMTKFLAPLETLDFDTRAAIDFGRVKVDLEAVGRPIGPYDMMIAAHARSMGMTLVTNNVREFERVDGLTVENWVES